MPETRDISAAITAPEQPVAATPDRLLSGPEVQVRTGYSRVQRWRLIKAGKFPAPLKLGAAKICWRESDITHWLASRQIQDYGAGTSAAEAA